MEVNYENRLLNMVVSLHNLVIIYWMNRGNAINIWNNYVRRIYVENLKPISIISKSLRDFRFKLLHP